MKYLFLLASIICGVNCFSQNPNPLLFQTWYLQSVQSSDASPLVNVLQISPSITPTLTIPNTLEFTGLGACNTFNGTFTNLTNNSWQPASFFKSGLDCDTTTHNLFEGNYFSFLQSPLVYYQITPTSGGLTLMMSNQIFGIAVFQNTPLGTKDFDIDTIVIYPNPSKTVVYINTNQLVISKIQILNSLGQNIKTLTNDFEMIDISELSTGVYILKIDTEFGTINKKIIKEE